MIYGVFVAGEGSQFIIGSEARSFQPSLSSPINKYVSPQSTRDVTCYSFSHGTSDFVQCLKLFTAEQGWGGGGAGGGGGNVARKLSMGLCALSLFVYCCSSFWDPRRT